MVERVVRNAIVSLNPEPLERGMYPFAEASVAFTDAVDEWPLQHLAAREWQASRNAHPYVDGQRRLAPVRGRMEHGDFTRSQNALESAFRSRLDLHVAGQDEPGWLDVPRRVGGAVIFWAEGLDGIQMRMRTAVRS